MRMRKKRSKGCRIIKLRAGFSFDAINLLLLSKMGVIAFAVERFGKSDLSR